MNLFNIKCTVEGAYKDGEDWVYPKGKKTEIELIKALLEICDSQRDEILDLTKQVRVVDEWEAYHKAECHLERAHRYFEELHGGLTEYKEVMEQLDIAKEKIVESKDYMDGILRKLREKNKP